MNLKQNKQKENYIEHIIIDLLKNSDKEKRKKQARIRMYVLLETTLPEDSGMTSLKH